MPLLSPPRPEEWTNSTVAPRSTGYALVNITDPPEVTIDHLVPGHRLTLTIRAWSNAPCILTIGTAVVTIPPRAWTTRTITLTAPDSLTLTIAGTTHIHIALLDILDHTPLPTLPTPAHVLSMQALFPRRDSTALRFDASRWNRATFDEAPAIPGTLVFDHGQWDGHRWHDTTDPTAWQDITTPITRIKTGRGVEAQGSIFTARAGMMHFSAVDDLDPRALGLTYGAPVKLIHWPTREAVFTGTVADVDVKRHNPTRSRRRQFDVTYTIVDAVARLASITRYGARAEGGDGSEPWNLRVARLMRSDTGQSIPYRIGHSVATLMAPIVWETSLARHLDALTASVGGSWKVARDNAVEITAADVPRTGGPTYTDATDTTPTHSVWSYTGADQSWTAADIVSAVTVTNHAAHIEDGQWRADATTETYTDATSETTWGGSAIRVDMTLATGVADHARTLLKRASDLPIPRAITLSPRTQRGPTHATTLMATATTLDPLTPLTIETGGDTFHTTATEIIHEITPRTWQTILVLAQIL